MERDKIYICSPFRVPDSIQQRGARATLRQHQLHLAWAIAMSRHAFEKGFFPVTPHLYLPAFVQDEVAAERRLALDWGLEWMGDCRALWKLDVPPSSGMQGELAHAATLRLPVVSITMDELSPFMPKSFHSDLTYSPAMFISSLGL